MSWNNQYQPPSGPPPGPFGFPSPHQYAPPSGPPPPQSRAYNPSYNPSYAPPSGPPPGQFGFPQPGGPSNAPGYQPSYNPSYGPPSGPPPSSGPPPVPGNRPDNTYAPPPGPPPMPHRTSSGTGNGYPGQSYHQNQANNNNGQGWQQNNPSYPGGAPIINWNTQGSQGVMNSNANGGSPGWTQGPPGGQTGYGTGGPGHPGGAPAMGNAHMPPTGQQMYGPAQNNNGPQMHFQYSMCTGRKKALSIGINYFGQQGELRGCINDSNNICAFLTGQFGYKKDDIVQLVDDATDPRKMPTRDNILQAMQWLVRDAKPNDSLFFHYSGHGGQTKDLDGDEADGYDEVPLDSFGNFVNRVIKFLTDQFKGVIPESGDAPGPLPPNEDEADPTFVSEINELLAEYIDSMERVRLRHSLNLVMSISARGNAYLQRCNLTKALLEKDPKRCAQVLSRALNLIYTLSALIHPFMPSTSDAVLRQLNAPARVIPSVLSTDILPGHKLGTPELLFSPIKDSKADEWRQKFGGTQKAVDAAVADNQPPLSKKKQAAAAKAAKAAKANAPSVPKTPEIIELEVKVKTQGERVRAIKEGKAHEGETLESALAELLALKASLKDAEEHSINNQLEAAGAQSAVQA
ncbi:unnamed protein product [Rhizoctonia solani]|uniref:WHEP-TRS domain-containing protein n=1 Tax=Rhizoctonia solani TaxID=456999 RepID=A0A8H3HX79_9AGAM|nr:unnamed protein product [Rhizoctonia solani]